MHNNKKNNELSARERDVINYFVTNARGKSSLFLLIASQLLEEWAQQLAALVINDAPHKLSNFETKRIFKELARMCNEDMEKKPDNVPDLIKLVNQLLIDVTDMYNNDLMVRQQGVMDYLLALGRETNMPGLKLAAAHGYGAVLLYRGPEQLALTAVAAAVTEIKGKNIPMMLLLSGDPISATLPDSMPGEVTAVPESNWAAAGQDAEWAGIVLNKWQRRGIVLAPRFIRLFHPDGAGDIDAEDLEPLIAASKKHMALFIGAIPEDSKLKHDPEHSVFVLDVDKVTKMNEDTQLLETQLTIGGEPLVLAMKG